MKISFRELSEIQKAIPVINHKPEEDSFARVTHDFCNKTTWLTNSIRVEDEAVMPDISGKIFKLDNENIIDIINGVLNRQDLYTNTHNVIIKSNDILVDTGFYINHSLGEIIFDESPMLPISVSYNYATDSCWKVAPQAGKILVIDHSELQFSDDVFVSSPVRFEIWAYNPADLPNKMIVQSVQYNSMRDIINEANLGTGVIKKVGDLPTDILVFPFNYASVKPLYSSYGMELRVFVTDHKELTGSYGTASFYLISRGE